MKDVVRKIGLLEPNDANVNRIKLLYKSKLRDLYTIETLKAVPDVNSKSRQVRFLAINYRYLSFRLNFYMIVHIIKRAKSKPIKIEEEVEELEPDDELFWNMHITEVATKIGVHEIVNLE